jgi:hypothetical protein
MKMHHQLESISQNASVRFGNGLLIDFGRRIGGRLRFRGTNLRRDLLVATAAPAKGSDEPYQERSEKNSAKHVDTFEQKGMGTRKMDRYWAVLLGLLVGLGSVEPVFGATCWLLLPHPQRVAMNPTKSEARRIRRSMLTPSNGYEKKA